jgi:formylglycine-generating enzyme required for sulfatase activity
VEEYGDRFLKGGTQGPEMVWLPGGTFRMGTKGVGYDSERPAREVKLGHYGVGQYPVTVGEFRRFVEATGYHTEAERGDGAYIKSKREWKKAKDASWRKPYLEQEDNHPVVCISWNDAKTYCDWLSKETGQALRTPDRSAVGACLPGRERDRLLLRRRRKATRGLRLVLGERGRANPSSRQQTP